jgi:predicted acyl esterase
MGIRLGLVVVCLLAVGRDLSAQAPAAADDFVKSHYAKYEYRIPMRDGVKLFASVYVRRWGFSRMRGLIRF